MQYFINKQVETVMSISKQNVEALFSIGDVIEDESNAKPLHIVAINDDHILIQMPTAGTDEINISLNALSEAVAALNSTENDLDIPLNRLAVEYKERYEDAIDEMWRKAGACQLL